MQHAYSVVRSYIVIRGSIPRLAPQLSAIRVATLFVYTFIAKSYSLRTCYSYEIWNVNIFSNMLFNSFGFLLFLPIVFLLYWFVFRPRRLQNLFMVIASYVFYGWWDWRFLFLIALTSVCSYASGLLLEYYTGNSKMQRRVSTSNIVINLLILGTFKYYNFFIENFAVLFRTIGYELDWPTIHIILPVGISFYTFQALSYTIDVYRGNIRATRDIIEFFAFISFFPQLVAGPIERASNLLPQFQRERRFDYAKAVDGMRQMLWGFFKKLVIADNCAVCVNSIWSIHEDTTGFVLLIGAMSFTFQIYCDFSGYSDIAIGCARLFGINLMRNFNFPYFSRNIPEFWRKWHVSLMTWFRDYIYFPLGGSRCAKWKAIRNTFIVFGVSGLWHGANWTFVCWGLYHACLITFYMLLGVNTKNKNLGLIAKDRRLPSIKECLQISVTFSLVVFGWIIFRAETMTDAYTYIAGICDVSLFDIIGSIEHFKGLQLTRIVPSIIVLIVCEWLQRDKQHALQMSRNCLITRNIIIRYMLYFILLLTITALAGTQSEFIYFQF